ncbi:MAG: 16S rRNA (cytosine(967)-C(5))-methyltransferase RsmB [Gammaproteobacteria bacterium]|nr:16S rRNA (cytosine(967)-C(5))-methyltransferase RsmB [Gammaproteobacteria bacterium]
MTPRAERAVAARNLNAILGKKRTIDWALARRAQSSLSKELTYGVLRHYFSLCDQVDDALSKSFRKQDLDLYGLLLVGAYQLGRTRIPAHAAIYETVEAAHELRKPWAKGVVNAVLRKLSERPISPSEHSFEHPEWLNSKLRDQYAEAEALMDANNRRAPMCLRVNTRRTTPRDYQALLERADIGYRKSWLPESLVLETPRPTDELPGFAEGLVAVQDIGAQLAIQPLAARLEPGQRVLDACAAPGGKLFHLLEAHDGLNVVAIDRATDRVQDLQRIAARLGHRNFTIQVADATQLSWWDAIGFDHVLVDVPCSGSGTLRRHPDIKVTRRWTEVESQLELQGRLLGNLWLTLCGGGTLLYCTCSILAEENDGIVGAFVETQADARVIDVKLPTGQATRFGWQLLPTERTTDGFYFALLQKDEK